MKIKKLFYLPIGFIGFGLGIIGAMFPFIPTVPFLLLAALGFARSSEKLDTWFKSTKVYKNNLENYVKGKGMTMHVKIKILSMVTALLAIGFVMMVNVPAGQMVLVVVWLAHVFYFMYKVKTIKYGK